MHAKLHLVAAAAATNTTTTTTTTISSTNTAFGFCFRSSVRLGYDENLWGWIQQGVYTLDATPSYIFCDSERTPDKYSN